MLDDDVWRKAPRDARFSSRRSMPYGRPTAEPTVVQVAYDDQQLYVAFRCTYAGPGQRDDNAAHGEEAIDSGELVNIFVDGHHDHSNAKMFAVNRFGERLDGDLADNGETPNYDWSGIWDVSTQFTQDSWTAEFAIPWSTIGVPPHDGKFALGILFGRQVPHSGELAFWSLPPPGANDAIASMFGHLVGLESLRPSGRIFLQPYVAAAVLDPAARLSRFRDFGGTAGNGGFYGGFYARYNPSGAFKVDATVNPDFSAVNPDKALSNLDRFELSRPEVRPFFAEDLTRFQFGDPEAPLFYSRRVGLRPGRVGAEEVPILYGAKNVVRAAGVEFSGMTVGLSNSGEFAQDDSVSVVRLNRPFEHGNRIGNILMIRHGDAGDYLATGIDGVITGFDEHLRVSGFIAGTATDHVGSGGIGGGTTAWTSDDYKLSASYLQASKGYDPQLGFIQQTDFAKSTLSARYGPRLNNDLISRVILGLNFTDARTVGGDPIYTRTSVSLGALHTDSSTSSFSLDTGKEHVADRFAIAGGRLPIERGEYDTVNATFTFETPSRRTLHLLLAYTEGQLFGGYQRIPSVKLELFLGRFRVVSDNRLYFVGGANRQSAQGLQASSQVLYAYSPKARSILAVEANTLDPQAVTKLVNTIAFGTLSSVSIVLIQSAPSVDRWLHEPERRAFMSFSYGASLF